MNSLKKTRLALAPSLLLSAWLMTPAFADVTSAAAENTGGESQEKVIPRTDADFIGSWSVTVKKGQIESQEKFSFLSGGVLLHSGPPMVLYPYSLRFNIGHGAWARDDKGSLIIRYSRSLYWAADGSYFDDEEVTGVLSLDKNNKLVGQLTVGMVRDGSEVPASDIKITLSGTKISAIKSGAATE